MFAKIQPSNVDKKSIEDQETIHLCNYMDVYYHEYIYNNINFMKATASDSQIFKFTLRKGDIIITKDSETPFDIAVPAFVPQDLPGIICGYHLAMIRPKNKDTLGEYLFRALQSEAISNQYSSFANGLTRYGIKVYSIGNALFPIPPLNEQKSIITFLKVITSEIDAIVADKQKLVKLLQEYRQTIISEVVTKGLDPNVEMKESGVEWANEIPEHWIICKLGYTLERNESGTWGNDFDDNGKIVLRSTEITIDGKWKIEDPALRDIDEREYKRCQLKKGDLLITKSSGSQLHIGKTVIVTEEIEKRNCVFSNFMQRIRLKKEINPKYVYYIFNSFFGREQLRYNNNTTTGLRNLNSNIISNLKIFLFNLDEQKRIIHYLNHKTNELDLLINTLHNQIEKLINYRQSLISEAVTGKIDVRNHN